MRGRAGVGAEATGEGGMEVGGVGVGGVEATGGVAHGLGSVSASGHTGGRIGGHTGDLILTPMAMRTRPSSPCHPPKSMCNPQHQLPPSPLHRLIGITVTSYGRIIPTCNNVQGDGGQ
jgi:hypothetical protein